MAQNLLGAGHEVVVWNRSTGPLEIIRSSGAIAVTSPAEVFAQVQAVIFMLANEMALDGALARGTREFHERMKGRLIISMGTNLPDYSRKLAQEIIVAGGRYVEAPVSGSRVPAMQGQLVGLLAGKQADLEVTRPILAPLCRKTIDCGSIGTALEMKLAINLMLNTFQAGMAEAVYFADKLGLDLGAFESAIAAGPMDCGFTQTKLPKLIARNYAVQAALSDACHSTQLISSVGRSAQLNTPMLDTAQSLYASGIELGLSGLDMCAVREVIADLPTNAPSSASVENS